MLQAAAEWLLEAAEGGSGAAEAPEMRLAVADAVASTGKRFIRPRTAGTHITCPSKHDALAVAWLYDQRICNDRHQGNILSNSAWPTALCLCTTSRVVCTFAGLLRLPQRPNDANRHTSLRAWLLVVELMEDEDDEVIDQFPKQESVLTA